jgi:hypothetical protein
MERIVAMALVAMTTACGPYQQHRDTKPAARAAPSGEVSSGWYCYTQVAQPARGGCMPEERLCNYVRSGVLHELQDIPTFRLNPCTPRSRAYCYRIGGQDGYMECSPSAFACLEDRRQAIGDGTIATLCVAFATPPPYTVAPH